MLISVITLLKISKSHLFSTYFVSLTNLFSREATSSDFFKGDAIYFLSTTQYGFTFW